MVTLTAISLLGMLQFIPAFTNVLWMECCTSPNKVDAIIMSAWLGKLRQCALKWLVQDHTASKWQS